MSQALAYESTNLEQNFSYQPSSLGYEDYEQLPEEYKKYLVKIISMQALSENEGGVGLGFLLALAPDNKRRKVVSRIAYEEVNHGAYLYKVLEDLGVSEEESLAIANGKYNSKLSDSFGGAKEVYGDEDHQWIDLILDFVLMDTAGAHIVGNFANASFKPWADACKKIVDEEKMHVGFGKREFKRYIAEDHDREHLKERFRYWYATALNFFGPPSGNTAKKLKNYGLKVLNNDEARDKYRAEIEALMEEYGCSDLLELKNNEFPYA